MFLKEKRKVYSKYTCSICGKERFIYDHTDVNHNGKWMKGCQKCFLDSINNSN